MIGADVMILAFGAGLLALTWVSGRAALDAARRGSRGRTMALGVGAVVLALAGVLAIAEAMVRLLQR